MLSAVALGTWWLTGFDKNVSGESRRDEFLDRAVRSLAVVLLSGLFLLVLEPPGIGFGGVPILILIPVSIAIVLRSSLSEIVTHTFIRLVDPELHGGRDFDPKKERRYEDAIAHLIRTGQRKQAIKLCEELKATGEVDLLTLENTLEYLGVKQGTPPKIKPLVEAGQLRQAGRFSEAEHVLKSLLAVNPADEGAAMMLLRLYAQDWHQPERAYALLHKLEKQPQISHDHLDFARRSIPEWTLSLSPTSIPESTPAPAALKSVDEMVAEGSFGLAVEQLEEKLMAQPGNFALQLKLAEVYAIHCKNLMQADKIVHQIERDAIASPEQIALAQAQLQEWKKLLR